MNTGITVMVILSRILNVYSYVFIADAIMSWFLPPGNKLRRILIMLTEPVVSLFRPICEKLFPRSRISIPHLFAFAFIMILQMLLVYLASYLFTMQ